MKTEDDPNPVIELEVNRKEINRRVEHLNKDIKNLIRHAQDYIKSLDPVSKLNFEDVTVTELRCEQCGSLKIHDVSYESDSEDNTTDCGFECEENHFTFVRKERY